MIDKARLADRIDVLCDDLRAALQEAEHAAQTVELDQTRQGRLSRMDAMQGQAMAKAAAQRARQKLRELAAARQRLDSEDFGDCEDCAEPIASARLELDPCVRLCIACAQAREKA